MGIVDLDEFKSRPIEFDDTDTGFKVKGINNSKLIYGEIKDSKTLAKCKVIITANAATIKFNGEKDIQIIFKVVGTPDEVVNSFDFAHAKNYYEFYSGVFGNNPKSIEALKEYKLVFQGGLSPLNSFLRIFKFQKAGFNITKAEIIKAILHIQENFNYKDKNQLLSDLEGFYFSNMYPDVIKRIQELEDVTLENVFEILDSI